MPESKNLDLPTGSLRPNWLKRLPDSNRYAACSVPSAKGDDAPILR